mgnify:CR=1 FL=1
MIMINFSLYMGLVERFHNANQSPIVLHLMEIFSTPNALGSKVYCMHTLRLSRKHNCMVEHTFLAFCSMLMVMLVKTQQSSLNFSRSTQSVLFWQMESSMTWKQQLMKLFKVQSYLYQSLLLVSDKPNLIWWINLMLMKDLFLAKSLVSTPQEILFSLYHSEIYKTTLIDLQNLC